MPTPEKASTIKETQALLEQSESVVLASYRQLSVSMMNKLRAELADGGVRMKVVKNTLIKRAADQAGITGLDPYLKGPTVLMASETDAVAPAKLLQARQREFRTMEIKAGILEKRAITAEDVRTLASLPPKEQILGQVVSTLNAPLQRLASALQGPLTQFVRVLDQVRAQKEAQA